LNVITAILTGFSLRGGAGHHHLDIKRWENVKFIFKFIFSATLTKVCSIGIANWALIELAHHIKPLKQRCRISLWLMILAWLMFSLLFIPLRCPHPWRYNVQQCWSLSAYENITSVSLNVISSLVILLVLFPRLWERCISKWKKLVLVMIVVVRLRYVLEPHHCPSLQNRKSRANAFASTCIPSFVRFDMRLKPWMKNFDIPWEFANLIILLEYAHLAIPITVYLRRF